MVSLIHRDRIRNVLAAGAGWLGAMFAVAWAENERPPSAENHWAFQSVSQPALPEGVEEQHAIDHFLRAPLLAKRLDFAPPADRRTLIRRLYLDMLGLPPAPAQVREFESADDPDAFYAHLVDTVLASPRYGERWAQHWLDLVRYADTHGFEVNTERPNAWHYRDYVIRAFNEDRPYDRFILEQLAGDTVGEDAATGFLVAAAVLLPGQIGKDEESKRLARQDALDEIVVGTCDTFLALSVGCARCHDHKFDPIPQRDYYAMQAFFAGVEYGERTIQDPKHDQKLAVIRERIAALEAQLDGVQPRTQAREFMLIDVEDGTHTTSLKNKIGNGAKSPGAGRGNKDDPGGQDRSPNLSRNGYTWWPNVKGEDVFTYNPKSAGRFRIWISWGAHGSGVHTRDARYVLDIDGNLETKEDQREIAKADQYYVAGVSEGKTKTMPLWSGFHDAGVHTLKEASRLVLRGGETKTVITGDVVMFERVAEDDDTRKEFPGLRAPVNPRQNVERFAPVEAKFVRFTSFATLENNKHEPCLDELEVFAAEGRRNVARTGTPTSSGNYANDGQHQLRHLNDGNYGNGKSWISNERGKGWVQIELEKPVVIDRIVWGRDRNGTFKDRLAIDYRIEVARKEGEWITVASSQDRVPHGTPYDSVAALARTVVDGADNDLPGKLEELGGLKEEEALLAKRDKAYAGMFRKPDVTHVLHRGDPEQKLDQVGASTLEMLRRLTVPADAPESERRAALAKWIGSPKNPLTARVMVNRIWQYHFGRGLVDTASDFGLHGMRPSHPELLDWLAAQFVKDGWSVKTMHRRILHSRAYRQSNRIDPAAEKLDGECRLLWRFPSRRLEAEAIRDGILAVSGELNLKMGGPGFNFFGSRGGLSGFPIIESFKDDGLRRMIYAHKVRMERAPIFGAFDCPDAGQTMARRQSSTTAIQALNLFNGQFVLDQADAFAARVQSEIDIVPAHEPYVERAFELALGRKPNKNELTVSVAVVKEHGLSTLCRVLFNCNEFLFLP